jgi:hypothetical protein
VEEEKRKEKRDELIKEAEKDAFRIMTPFDIAVQLDMLKQAVDYVLVTVDEIEKSVKKLSKKTRSGVEDILFLLFIMMLALRQSPIPQQAVTVNTEQRAEKTFSIRELHKMIQECKKSVNPVECMESWLYGG